ncbi:P pilus assembly/Cpx signaling pathway [Candidatus Vecturithrix granuli]|uniref:P pilus assembly/Cpx signaling pathway n=1 Tax=Vecturithrix granuli TaxID=1499967 RepID=A0A081BVV3_VECG1|nr:P pilus assembly/Cpx signaling pathway [Candidatus Vecturithrix granuli]
MTRTHKVLSVALILAVGITMIGMTLDAQAYGKKDNRPTNVPGGQFPAGPEGQFPEGPGGQFPGKDEGRGMGFLEMLTRELDLTPDQQGEITKIMATFRQEQQAKIKERIAAQREKMQQLFTAEFDEAKVREFFQQMEVEREAEREKMREDRFVERVKLISAINAVLTPEQLKIVQEKFDKLFEEDRPMFNRPMFNRPGFDKEERPPVNN